MVETDIRTQDDLFDSLEVVRQAIIKEFPELEKERIKFVPRGFGWKLSDNNPEHIKTKIASKFPLLL